MNDVAIQAKLSVEQIQAFYHDGFVEDQVRDFRDLAPADADALVVDVGGGCGFFARRLSDATQRPTRVIDMDPQSIATCHDLGINGQVGDALAPQIQGDEKVVCFNLILHHLVGANERETRALQLKALKAWRGTGAQVFVNEYIYQSLVGQVSPRLIYEITSSPVLSFLARQAARIVPALRANTFGVGVRFRSHEQWREMFAEAGFRVVSSRVGRAEHVSPPLRGMLIKTIRRDSFLLEAA